MNTKEFLTKLHISRILDDDKIKECYNIQQKLLQENRTISIEDIFLRKNYLTHQQIAHIKGEFPKTQIDITVGSPQIKRAKKNFLAMKL